MKITTTYDPESGMTRAYIPNSTFTWEAWGDTVKEAKDALKSSLSKHVGTTVQITTTHMLTKQIIDTL